MSTHNQIPYKKNIEREITLERLSGPKKGADCHFLQLTQDILIHHFILRDEIQKLIS